MIIFKLFSYILISFCFNNVLLRQVLNKYSSITSNDGYAIFDSKDFPVREKMYFTLKSSHTFSETLFLSIFQ